MSVTVGQIYRHEHDGQRFRVRTVADREVVLDPIDKPRRRGNGTYAGEVFALAGMWPELLKPPTWTLLTARDAAEQPKKAAK